MAQPFNPSCELIHEVVPPLGLEVIGPYVLIGFIAGEQVKGTDDH
jgi:hypothetical protein